ncbi:MAG TPA: hypothetical protein VHM20_07860, partial [Gammaproteobacteria bacterium]|nr:hypothetical protein [Gammaproteobacteria bacterium]
LAVQTLTLGFAGILEFTFTFAILVVDPAIGVRTINIQCYTTNGANVQSVEAVNGDLMAVQIK